MTDINRPFRWDLVRPDQLGTLLDGVAEPDLWFLDDLVACAAKVVARCADGDLFFVGRSADTVFDLLSGLLEDTPWLSRLHLLPLSLGHRPATGEADTSSLLRANLTATGITPHLLARGRGPTVFVDIVSWGRTYAGLYQALRRWIDDEREPWDVIRRRVRFTGLICRTKSSPNAWRWQQHADWTADLPARAVNNVSVDFPMFRYFADNQKKLTRSFTPWFWGQAEPFQPLHSDDARKALAEAVAVVEAGRTKSTRDTFVRHLTAEPAIAEPWLRALITQLRR